MPYLDSHTISLSKSCCNTLLSSVPPTVRYTAILSPNRHTFEVSSSGRSLMYMRNRISPKKEPCGMPDVTGTDPDSSPSRITVCDRLPRKAWIQGNEFPLTPYWWSFQRSLEWFTLSKAFEKSSSTRSVCFPALALLARSLTNVTSWVLHDLFSLKPCCRSYKRSCLSMCLSFTTCETIICSRTLQRIQVREIGW